MSARKNTTPVKSDPDVAAQLLADWLIRSMQAPKDSVSPATQGWVLDAYRAVLQGRSCHVTDGELKVDAHFIGNPDEPLKPLCLRTYPLPQGQRSLLYLRQMENFEERLRQVILARLGDRPQPWAAPSAEVLAGLSPSQAEAMALLARKSFVVVTGGPGSGKTHLLAKILRYVLDSAVVDPAGIRLMAPTGRAARIIGEKMKEMNVAPPRPPETIHAFLQNFDEAEKLTMVVVDESSMVDLMHFNRLLAKLPPECTLVLVGDPQQLPSVEVGTVLADISSAEALRGNCARLAGDYRTSPEIGALADAVMAHARGASLQVLAKAWQPYLRDLDAAEVVKHAAVAYGPMLAAARAAKSGQQDKIAAALACINRFRVLCSQRHGDCGAVTLSQAIAKALGIDADRPTDGALIMVTRNDNHNSQLRNGDVGLIIDGKVYFPGYFKEETAVAPVGVKQADQRPVFRAFGYNELPDPVLAFATTVHKAQGSEYTGCLAVISQPKEHAEFVSKQILYTAITRARKEFHLYAEKDVLAAAVERVVEQASGLRERLSVGR